LWGNCRFDKESIIYNFEIDGVVDFDEGMNNWLAVIMYLEVSDLVRRDGTMS
jgi:Ser/Thr protein kinase RdoA (MazF antagonist)